MYGSRIGQIAENSKRCKDERSSGLWIRNFLQIVTTIRASFTTICCRSVFFWFEMIFLCWTKFTTVILPLSLMIIGKFSRDHAVTVLQQNNFWRPILIGRNQSNSKSILSWELWNMQMFSLSEMTSQLLTGHVQQCYFGNSWTRCWN